MYQTTKLVSQESNTHVEYEWYLLPENYQKCVSHPRKDLTSNRWINDEGNSVTDLHCPACNMTAYRELVDKRKDGN